MSNVPLHARIFLWFGLVQVFCTLTQTLWVYMHNQPIVSESAFPLPPGSSSLSPLFCDNPWIFSVIQVSCLGLSPPLSSILYTLSSCDFLCKSSRMVKRSFSAGECLVRLVLCPNKRWIMEYNWIVGVQGPYLETGGRKQDAVMGRVVNKSGFPTCSIGHSVGSVDGRV